MNKIDMYTGISNGNKFIVIDERNECWFTPKVFENFIKKIEFDSILIISNSNKAFLKLTILEKNGSKSDACINGTLLAGYFFSNDHEVSIESEGNIFNVIKNDDVIVCQMKRRLDEINIEKIDEAYFIDILDPHIILFNVEDQQNLSIVAENFQYGFKLGVNVNFIKNTNYNNIELITYERGVCDFTLSCASGSLSTAIVVNKINEIKFTEYNVINEGGQYRIDFANNHIQISTKVTSLKLEKINVNLTNYQ